MYIYICVKILSFNRYIHIFIFDHIKLYHELTCCLVTRMKFKLGPMQLQKLKTPRRLSIRMTSGLCERRFFFVLDGLVYPPGN